MKTETDGPPLLPEDPFVFYQEPPDWRWLSFLEAGRQIANWRSVLAHLAPPARVGIRSTPSVEALLADLAVRSCGLLTVPLPAASESGASADVEDLDAVLDLDEKGVLATDGDAAKQVERTVASEESPRPSGGDCGLLGGCFVTKVGDGNPSLEHLPTSDLETAVGRLVGSDGSTEERCAERGIVVHGRSLAERSERIVIEWAVRTAAAIVVAPSPEALAETVFWVRPTVIHGSADELRAWPTLFRAGESRQRGLRSRFRRLRQVIVGGGERLDGETEAFYVDLGAEVVSLGGG
jgi:hypothetical protein